MATPTAWNPADAGPGFTFANNNLTAILPGTNASVRSTTAKTTGKWYFEVVTYWAGSGAYLTGIMLPTSILALNTFPGLDDKSYGIINVGPWVVYFNSSPTNYGGSGVNLDVVGVCLDLDNNFLYATKNGTNIIGDPSALTGGHPIFAGTWYAAAAGSTGVNLRRAVMANFGAANFAFSPPAPFSAWDTTQFTYRSFETSNTSIVPVTHMMGV